MNKVILETLSTYMSTYFVDLLCACDYVKTITCTSISDDVSRTRSRLPSHDASKLPSGDHAHGPLSCVALENSMFQPYRKHVLCSTTLAGFSQ